MKTFAELKRKLQPGVKIEMTWAYYGMNQKQLGVRVVEVVHTNAIAVRTSNGVQSWLYWEKAGNYLITEKGFIVMYDDPENNGRQLPLIVYEFR